MVAARRDRRCGRLGHVDAAAGGNFDIGAGDMIPAAEVGKRDAEAIGDGHQSVAAAGSVKDHAGGGGCTGRLRNDDGIEALERTSAVKLVGRG